MWLRKYDIHVLLDFNIKQFAKSLATVHNKFRLTCVKLWKRFLFIWIYFEIDYKISVFVKRIWLCEGHLFEFQSLTILLTSNNQIDCTMNQQKEKIVRQPFPLSKAAILSKLTFWYAILRNIKFYLISMQLL